MPIAIDNKVEIVKKKLPPNNSSVLLDWGSNLKNPTIKRAIAAVPVNTGRPYTSWKALVYIQIIFKFEQMGFLYFSFIFAKSGI